MPYTADQPANAYNPDELAARIPGWGVDRDPKDRPSVPKERRVDPSENGAHWDFPERQSEKWPRERSLEHKVLPPVFGTACPPKGVSGAIRRYAYRYSEARAAHWLLLMVADRVDAAEHQMASILALSPENPVVESGMLSEFSHNGLQARLGQRRADAVHHTLDPLIIIGPWVAAGGAAVRGLRTIQKVVTGNGRAAAAGSD